MSSTTALSGCASSFAQLGAARVGVGIGEASASPAAASLLSDYFPKRLKGSIFALYTMGMYVGMGASLMIGGAFVARWSGAFGLAGGRRLSSRWACPASLWQPSYSYPYGSRSEAIRCALSRWAGLTLFLDEGRTEIDNNTVERSIRPLALTRKNSLFAGSDGGAEHWAILASLIETAKLNEIDPQAYLTDVITRIVGGHPKSQVDQLMPWKRAPAIAVAC